MTPAELLAQSLAKFQTANRIDGHRNSYRRDNPTEYDKVMAYLAGGPRPAGVVSDMGMGFLYEEDARRALTSGPTGATGATGSTGATGVPGPIYPASYYTGPLGQANFLPPKQGAFLIDFYGGIGTTTAGVKAALAEREQAMGRKFDGLMTHYGEGTHGGTQCMAADRVAERFLQWIHDRGCLPLVSWSPTRTLDSVLSGASDACFQAAADHFKSFDFPLMLRLWWEFDLPHVSYHPNSPQQHVDAWRHVVDLFKARGATNVGFWWCPCEFLGTITREAMPSYYPGDGYVDWVGTDVYNWCYVNETSCWATPHHSGWAEFWEIFDYTNVQTFHNMFGTRKPFVVGETGSVYDPNAAGKKGNWFRDIPRAAKNMEYMRGITFYDADVSAVEGPKANFRVDHLTSNPDPLAGFVAMAKDPWFNTRT